MLSTCRHSQGQIERRSMMSRGVARGSTCEIAFWSSFRSPSQHINRKRQHGKYNPHLPSHRNLCNPTAGSKWQPHLGVFPFDYV